MTYQSLLTSECEISSETDTVNAFGEDVRGFDNPTTVKCRLNPVGGGDSDIALGQVSEMNRAVLYSAPDTSVSTGDKVVLDSVEDKVDRVRPYRDGSGNLHHKVCDIQEVT